MWKNTAMKASLVTRMEKMGGAIHPSKVRAGTPYSAFLIYGHDHVTPKEEGEESSEHHKLD